MCVSNCLLDESSARIPASCSNIINAPSAPLLHVGVPCVVLQCALRATATLPAPCASEDTMLLAAQRMPVQPALRVRPQPPMAPQALLPAQVSCYQPSVALCTKVLQSLKYGGTLTTVDPPDACCSCHDVMTRPPRTGSRNLPPDQTSAAPVLA